MHITTTLAQNLKQKDLLHLDSEFASSRMETRFHKKEREQEQKEENKDIKTVREHHCQ